MGVIDVDAARALISGQRFSRGSTKVAPAGMAYAFGGTMIEVGDHSHSWTMRLFGNTIALRGCFKPNGELLVALRNCGWSTDTTKNRLNAILAECGDDRRISTFRGQWYIGTAHWPDDSAWTVTGGAAAVKAFAVRARLEGHTNFIYGG